MAIKPIAMNAEKVRALLAGQKTQERLVMKRAMDERSHCAADAVCHCPADDTWIAWWGGGPGEAAYWARETARCYPKGGGFKARYAVGDILWVREALVSKRLADAVDWPVVHYAADGALALHSPGANERDLSDANAGGCSVVDWDWKRDILPAMFMPKDLARLWRRVTGVRAERVQDITDEDALAEGITLHLAEGAILQADGIVTWAYGERILGEFRYARDAYFVEWDTIYGKGAAAKNPWVFVYEFEACEKPATARLGGPEGSE